MKEEEDCIHIQDDEIERMEVELAPQVTIPIGNTAFDVHFQLSVESLKEEADPKAQLIHRLSKFFEYNKTIESGQHFRSRREPAYQLPNVQPVSNMLILFGSDFKKFKVFKTEFETKEIHKINDSNCRLVYEDFETAWSAIIKNAKEPEALVNKFEGENPSIPKCWFQMKPYTYLESLIDVQVRFATTEDIEVQPEKESLINSYKDSKEIFNSQESRLKDEEKIAIEAKKQKIQFRKQKNTEILYKNYEKENNDWKAGMNSNPGANRNEDRERSRSRDKPKKQFADEGNEDAKSNCSYGFINKQFNKMTLGEGNVAARQEELDLSFDMQGSSAVAVNAERAESSSAYNWKGSEVSGMTKWSYREYMSMKEKEDEMNRKKKIQVVIID